VQSKLNNVRRLGKPEKKLWREEEKQEDELYSHHCTSKTR